MDRPVLAASFSDDEGIASDLPSAAAQF